MFNGSQPFWNEPTNYPYFAFWSASTNLLSRLKWTIDLIHWSDPLIRSIDLIHWSDPLIWYIDLIHWSDTLIWSIDLIHSDFVQQVRLLHCCVLRREDRGSYNVFVFVFVFVFALYLLLYMYYIFERTDRGGIALEVHPSSREQQGPHFITDRTQPSAPRFVFLFSSFVFVFLICIYIWIDSCMGKCISNDQEPFK